MAFPGNDKKLAFRDVVTLTAAALLPHLVQPSAAYAMSGFSLDALLARPEIRWLEEFRPGLERTLSLDLAIDPGVTMTGSVQALLRDEGLHPFIEAREMGRAPTGFLPLANSLPERAASIKPIEFYLGGRRIHGFSVKAVALPPDEAGNPGRISMLGNLPVLDASLALHAFEGDGNWPDRSTALAVAWDSMHPGSGDADQLNLDGDQNGRSPVLSSEEIYMPGPSALKPAWRFVLKIGSLPYEVIADDREILSFNPQFFDAAASANVYLKNKQDGTLGNLPFMINDGQSHLENPRFRTDFGYPEGRAVADAGNKFDFSTSSRHFQEASVFAYANTHADYLGNLGFSWAPTNPIVLRVAECYDTTECARCPSTGVCKAKANAVYVPSDPGYDNYPPAIRVGQGDNVLLKDLHLDNGVTSHEFGHHVVFTAITQYGVGTEALQLHEGLSDFFVMMRNDSPCLGSGICTGGTQSICSTTQCLRSADNTLTYGSAEFRVSLDHQKGQLVSGFLWDLKVSGIANNDLVRMTLGAIELLPSGASFGDFLAALIKSDETLFASAHKDAIEQKALARNINASPTTDSLRSPVSASKSRRSSGNIFGCTVIQSGIYVHPKGTTVDNPVVYGEFDTFLALLVAIPILLALKSLLRRTKGK
ncbi:MAG: hypothetical protein RIQ81_1497 [Pseudomonadota bacterium]